MPLQATSGAASYDAFGGGVAAVPNYIEDVFSTYLYTGNGSTQTINNGIDLAGEGGLVWFKRRDAAAAALLFDSVRGVTKFLNPTGGAAEGTSAAGDRLTAYNTNGFSLGTDPGSAVNASGASYVSWTFREQPKFFDVVTYTGNGALPNQLISHSLGAVPGCIIIKATSAERNWIVWHRGNETTNYTALSLNLTAASGGSVGSGDLPTATQFKPGAFFDPDYNNGNETGVTYVAYIFAHNAGGFGLTGTDNVISCGSLTTDSSGNGSVTLGYEPQWILLKRTDDVSQWYLADNMRGMPVSGDGARLFANLSNAESTSASWIRPNATGFTIDSGMFASAVNLIYIAIRRGPMKVPTDGTKVFNVVSQTPSGTTTVTNSFASDMVLSCQRSNGGGWGFNVADKLRGSSIASGSRYLTTPTTAAEGNFAGYGFNLTNTNVQENFWNSALGVSTPVVYEIFRRAPGFFDEVCYTGDNNAGRAITHNLTVVPEMIIVKKRSGTGDWSTYHSALGATKSISLNSTAVPNTHPDYWNDTTPTSTAFYIGGGNPNNYSPYTYVAYLFATCAGVSKVGSYTGTGTTKQVDCGFTGGARFVLIKRTDSTGDWYVWDSARGIVAGNDPYLLLNSTAAEVTSTDYVDTYSAGFEITSTAPAAINASGGTFIFLAIA